MTTVPTVPMVGIVGIGTLGQTVISQINGWKPEHLEKSPAWEEKRPPVDTWRIFGRKSDGRKIELLGKSIPVEGLLEGTVKFAGLTHVVCCVPRDAAVNIVEAARSAGSVVIDCSDAFVKMGMAYVPTKIEVHEGRFPHTGIVVPRRRSYPADTAFDVVRILHSLLRQHQALAA